MKKFKNSKNNLTLIKMDIAITKLSSKGQVIIPKSLREGLKEGEEFLVIKEKNSIILKKISDLKEKILIEDMKFLKKVDSAWEEYKKGEYYSLNEEDFLEELEKW